MDDKIYWMYGFWVVLSGAKSVHGMQGLLTSRQMQMTAPLDKVLLTAFWTVAFLFYGYVCLRRLRTGAAR